MIASSTSAVVQRKALRCLSSLSVLALSVLAFATRGGGLAGTSSQGTFVGMINPPDVIS